MLSGSAAASEIWSANLFSCTSVSSLISPFQLVGYYTKQDHIMAKTLYFHYDLIDALNAYAVMELWLVVMRASLVPI